MSQRSGWRGTKKDHTAFWNLEPKPKRKHRNKYPKGEPHESKASGERAAQES